MTSKTELAYASTDSRRPRKKAPLPKARRPLRVLERLADWLVDEPTNLWDDVDQAELSLYLFDPEARGAIDHQGPFEAATPPVLSEDRGLVEESPNLRHPLETRDLTFLDVAPIQIEETTMVEAAPGRLWPALADATAWTSWFAGVNRAFYTSPGPHGVGSIRFVEVSGLQVNEEVLAFEPDRRFAFRVLQANRPGIASMVEEVTLEPVGPNTRVVYRQALALRWPLAAFNPLLRFQLRRALRRGLRGLSDWVAGA